VETGIETQIGYGILAWLSLVGWEELYDKGPVETTALEVSIESSSFGEHHFEEAETENAICCWSSWITPFDRR